jgi:hypothetical protein
MGIGNEIKRPSQNQPKPGCDYLSGILSFPRKTSKKSQLLKVAPPCDISIDTTVPTLTASISQGTPLIPSSSIYSE